MNIEDFRTYCLEKPGTEDGTPFGPDTLVFKVMGKMFALTGLNNTEFKVNLKCDPERAIELRDSHEEVQPGYHMSKVHWNTVSFEGTLSDKFLVELIDHSYDLVVASLKKSDREKLNEIK